MIEIIVAISIIVILSGMLIVAVRGISNSSKSKQTHVALENGKSLIAAMDALNRMGPGPSQWWWWRGGPLVDPSKGTGDLTYWTKPDPNVTQWTPTILPAGAPSLDAPGFVKDSPEFTVNRNASRAIINTSVVMGLLASVPANRTALSNLPAAQVYTPEWYSPATGALTGPGNDGWLNFGTDTPEPIQYVQGCHVRYQGQGWVCVTSHAAGPAPAGGGNWATDTTPAPLLRDGWGNPIIFVPATGLTCRMLNGGSAYSSSDVTQKFIVVSPEGQVTGNGTNNPTVVRAGKPFFASAGPDGDFSTGDDNLYSFEQ